MSVTEVAVQLRMPLATSIGLAGGVLNVTLTKLVLVRGVVAASATVTVRVWMPDTPAPAVACTTEVDVPDKVTPWGAAQV